MGAARGCFVNLTKLTHGTVLRFLLEKWTKKQAFYGQKRNFWDSFTFFSKN